MVVEPDRASETGERESFPSPAPDVELPLIGQAAAAESIRTAIERAFTMGTPALVTLEGGRGAGKTRLLTYASEIAARLANDVRIYYGAVRDDGDGSYAPFGRILLEAFDIAPASMPTSVRAQMATVVSRTLQADDPIRIGATTHLLGHVAGVPFPDSPFLARLEARPDELHRRACRAVRELLEGEAQRHPVLLLLDNMHAASSDGLDVLREIVGAEAHLAVVVAGASPIAAAVENFGTAEMRTTCAIAPLVEDDVAAMLHVLLPALESAPEPLVSAVTHRSQGNPSAIRELVFALHESGLFVPSEGGTKTDLERLERGDLPVTLDDALRARLARLDPLERATLDRASIVGEVFWDGAVLAQMRTERPQPGRDADPLGIWQDDDDALAVARTLTALEEKGFVDRIEGSDLPGARELTFTRAGTRSMLYDAVPEALRVKRHAAVARWLAVVAELRREGVAAMIAPHLERAGLAGRAGRAYLEAAAYERMKLHTTTALRFTEKALPLIAPDDVARRIDALWEHGRLLTTVGRYDEAIGTFTEMLTSAWSLGARSKGALALDGIARVHRRRGQDELAQQFLLRALELFRTAGDERGVARTLEEVSQVLRARGDLGGALTAASEALGIRRAHGDARGIAASLTTLGAIELTRGRLDEAERLLNEALSQGHAVHDVEETTQSYNALGIVAYERGHLDAAIRAWRTALDQARGVADRRSECFLSNNLGEALTESGRFDEASTLLTRARELANGLGDKLAIAEVERNIGILALRRGDDRAGEILARARALAMDYGGLETIGLVERAIGQLRARTLFGDDGEQTTAEESFMRSIAVFRESGNEKEAARSMAELGFHLLERQDVARARSTLEEARTIMRRIGLAQLSKVERTLAELS